MSNRHESTPLPPSFSVFLCFAHWVGPAKPIGLFSGELYSVRVKTAQSVPHFAQQIQHKQKHTWNFTAVGLKSINIKAGAKSSQKSYQNIPAEQPLNKLLPATTEIWDFLPVTWFYKGILQAASKMFRQPPQGVKRVLYSSVILIK